MTNGVLPNLLQVIKNKKEIDMGLKARIDSWLFYHDPWYWWRKAKEKYSPPKPVLIKGEFSGYFGLPMDMNSYKGLQFFCEGLGWKTKYGMVRHEWNPIICFVWTNPWKTFVKSQFGDFRYNKRYWFGWTFMYIDNGKDVSDNVWESMLEYISKKKKNENQNH